MHPRPPLPECWMGGQGGACDVLLLFSSGVRRGDGDGVLRAPLFILRRCGDGDGGDGVGKIGAAF